MGVTAFPQPPNYPLGHAEVMQPQPKSADWMGIAVGGSFLVGSLLLLSGKRRAGLLVSAGAMALTVLDQQETVREWWHSLPKYLDQAQHLLDQAQQTVDDLASKREKLRGMFNR